MLLHTTVTVVTDLPIPAEMSECGMKPEIRGGPGSA